VSATRPNPPDAVRRALVATAAALLALAGCGGSGANKHLLTPAQKQGLFTRITLIRQSAAAGDVGTTERRLRGFRRAVSKLQQQGGLEPALARALVAGAERALARVPSDVHPPAPRPSTTPAPAPKPLPPGQAKKHDEHGKHPKHGKHGEEGD
jgi:hypothetical protein